MEPRLSGFPSDSLLLGLVTMRQDSRGHLSERLALLLVEA